MQVDLQLIRLLPIILVRRCLVVLVGNDCFHGARTIHLCRGMDILHLDGEGESNEKNRKGRATKKERRGREKGYSVLFYHYHPFETRFVSLMLFNNMR